MIKGKNVLSHLFSGITPKKINKFSHPKMSRRMHIHLGKGKCINLFNVGDVREIS
jgi:hypothetical protein